jgi:tRNA (uracil-5-)-methyltransferase TRM9
MSGPQQPTASEIETETQRFHSTPTAVQQESEFVHDVYNEIAQHFSQTRYKPWPIVGDFLETRPRHSLGVDVGCGNGKYLAINDSLYIIGSDYSTGLIGQAKQLHGDEKCNDILVADGLNLPHSANTFDFAISIAVIHHFADEKRRVDAVKEILRVLNKGGQALIYCWALEQKNSRRGYHEGMDQDVLVPWVLAKKAEKKPKQKKGTKLEQKPAEEETLIAQENEKEEKLPVKMRFYHLYKQGELVENCIQAGGRVVRDGYERDNWWAVVEKV